MNQWLLEVLPGVFVGRLSARVRDHLWATLAEALPLAEGAYAAVIEQTNEAEQGFRIQKVGEFRYDFEDFTGLLLVTRTRTERETTESLDGPPDPSW